jgi:hypothetical protein
MRRGLLSYCLKATRFFSGYTENPIWTTRLVLQTIKAPKTSDAAPH